jgi:NADPH-dependent glutamate synthase beta subunit-like oxidoreductase
MQLSKPILVFILGFICLAECQNQTHEYCVVGAGPAGLQMAYFLHKSNRNYILYERNKIVGIDIF